MPDTLSCVALMAPREARHADLGDVLRADARLLPQRRHQAEGLAAVLHALAHRVDGRVVGLQRVVDQDAAVAGEIRASCASSMFGRTPTAMTTRSAGTVSPSVELHARDALARRRSPAVFARMRNSMPRFSSAALSSAPAGASSWRSISVSSRCTTVTCMPRRARPCAASRPNNPPPMTTARRSVARALEHAVHVVEVAEGHDAGQILARQRQHDRIGAGGDQQPVVGRDRAAARTHHAPLAVDRRRSDRPSAA